MEVNQEVGGKLSAAAKKLPLKTTTRIEEQREEIEGTVRN